MCLKSSLCAETVLLSKVPSFLTEVQIHFKSLNLSFQVKKQVHHVQNDLRIHEDGVIEIPSYLQSVEDIVAFFKESINDFVRFEKTRILSMIFKEGATIKISKNLAFILGVNIDDDYLFKLLSTFDTL